MRTPASNVTNATYVKLAHMNPSPPLGQAEEEGNHPYLDGELPPPALGGEADRLPQPGRGGSAPISHS